MIQFEEFKTLQPSFAVLRHCARYTALPDDLQHKCLSFLPRSDIITLIENTYRPVHLLEPWNRVFRFNTSYLLAFLTKYMHLYESDDELWRLVCRYARANTRCVIRYEITRKQYTERHHTEEWDQFHGILECMDSRITYEKPSYWYYSLVDHMLGKVLSRNEETYRGGYCDDY